MTRRRARLRTVVVALAAGVAVAISALGVVTWTARTTAPSARVFSAEGGVSVAVPRNWAVDKLHPTDPDHQEFLNGREKAVLGVLQRGGFWVSRWPATAGATTATIEARLRVQQRAEPRTDWSLRRDIVAGRPAVSARYSERPKAVGRFGATRFVVRELIAGGYVFQLGTWTTPAAGDVGKKLEKIAASLEIFRPMPWTADLVDTDARLRLPGGWVERKSDLGGVIFHALAPGDPTEAWAYVFRFKTTPRETVRGARANITNNGGKIRAQTVDRLDGRRVPRLDFTFPDGEFGMARDVEWFISDGRGGTFVLAVGHRAGDPAVAERIAGGWRS